MAWDTALVLATLMILGNGSGRCAPLRNAGKHLPGIKKKTALPLWGVRGQ